MIKLLDLLNEIKGSSKAIIMAGAAGSGKSTFVKQIRSDLEKYNWEELNADKYVEDENSPMYNNLSKASSQIEKVDLPNAIKSQKNFLYDTTGTNVNRVVNIKDSVSDSMMVMIYTNPIVSFIRNFKRERKVPTIGVLSSWNNVYKNISEYKNIFRDKFFLIQSDVSPAEQKMIAEFQKAYESNKLKEFFSDLLKTGEFKSTFKKDPNKEKSPEEKAKSKQLIDNQIDILSNQFNKIETDVQDIKDSDISNVVTKVKSFVKS
jgi:predicted kinase